MAYVSAQDLPLIGCATSSKSLNLSRLHSSSVGAEAVVQKHSAVFSMLINVSVRTIIIAAAPAKVVPTLSLSEQNLAIGWHFYMRIAAHSF